MSRPRVGDRSGDFRRRSDGSVDTELDETTELELVVLDMLEDLGNWILSLSFGPFFDHFTINYDY